MSMKLGAYLQKSGRCEFKVWAPFLEDLAVKIISPTEKNIQLQKDACGYWSAIAENINPDSQYFLASSKIGDKPDPASFYQPQGVHGPSAIIDHNTFHWTDQRWNNVKLSEMILYELHTGTFTPEGTFEAIIPRLNDLKEIGINTIEIMPVAQFPGQRNWGYDGVDIYAVQNSYGGPEGLKKLINACHKKGMAVVLDVVYNHLGPEGNYLSLFGPYFTSKYHTPWGHAINFDDAYSDEVRRFFIENALYWFEYFHVDALRLDAVHAICDFSAKPFLLELAEAVDNWNKKNKRNCLLIAESDLNDTKIIQSRRKGGYGLHAQWSDDFHHAIHALLTKEETGYYKDFGQLDHLRKSLEESFVYSGQYSEYRKRSHGNKAKPLPSEQFVVFIQNHDQVGNRLKSDRLSKIISFEELKLAAGLLLFSPYVPLLFMGEEYGEESPFNYFVSHTDKDLIEAVRKGRQNEFSSFQWEGKIRDPQDKKTFLDSKIQWNNREKGWHKTLLKYYKDLIKIRKTQSSIKNLARKNIDVQYNSDQNTLYFRRWFKRDQVLVVVNFSDKKQSIKLKSFKGQGDRLIDSVDKKYSGPGSKLKKTVNLGRVLDLKPHQFVAFKVRKK